MKMGEFRKKTESLPDDAQIVAREVGSDGFTGRVTDHVHQTPTDDGKGQAVITYGPNDQEFPHAL
jgi:hypothetical protein